MDHNSGVGRQHAKTKEGIPRYNTVLSNVSSQWVVKRQRKNVYNRYFESGLEGIRIEYETRKSRKNTKEFIHCRISW